MFFNPFHASVLFLCPLKTSGFLAFSKGIEMEHCCRITGICSQLTFACPKSAIKKLEKGVNYV